MESKHLLFEREALKLIHEKGFKGTTMRVLAAQMNCDVANIYNYIDSKQDLLERHLFELSAAFHLGIDQIKKTNYKALDKVRQIIHLYVRMSYQKPYQMSLLVNEWRHLDTSRQEAFLSERRAYEQKVQAILASGIKKKQLRKMDPEVATHLVLSATRWLFNYFTEERRAVNPLELEREISEFVMSGVEI